MAQYHGSLNRGELTMEGISRPARHRLASAFLCPFLGAMIAAIILFVTLGRDGDWLTASLAGSVFGAFLSARYLLFDGAARRSSGPGKGNHRV